MYKLFITEFLGGMGQYNRSILGPYQTKEEAIKAMNDHYNEHNFDTYYYYDIRESFEKTITRTFWKSIKKPKPVKYPKPEPDYSEPLVIPKLGDK